MAMQRGDRQTQLLKLLPAVFLQRGKPAVEFRKVLGNPGVEAVSSHYALSQLGLARALRLRHDLAGSRSAYEQFFRDWRGADPGMPLLSTARREYAGLRN